MLICAMLALAMAVLGRSAKVARAAVVGFAALPASLLFGAVYQNFGATAAFTMGSALATAAALTLPRPL